MFSAESRTCDRDLRIDPLLLEEIIALIVRLRSQGTRSDFKLVETPPQTDVGLRFSR
jgi:hypothetical protein